MSFTLNSQYSRFIVYKYQIIIIISVIIIIKITILKY